MYNGMANGEPGYGRGTLSERGLVEWVRWIGKATRTENSLETCFKKFELHEPDNEIVILLANIIQEVT